MRLKEVECPKCQTVFHSKVCPFCGHRYRKNYKKSMVLAIALGITILVVLLLFVLL